MNRHQKSSFCSNRVLISLGMDLHIKKQHKDEITQIEVCNVCSIQIQTKAKLRKHLKNVHQVVEDMELMGESE